MSKFNIGDRVRYTYNEKTDNGEVTGVAGDVVIRGVQWYRLRLDGYDPTHTFLLPESGMELLDQGVDLYARERENLIEASDPIVVVDELLELRREVKKLRAKVASGVEAAHDMQRNYFEGNSLDTEHLSIQDDAAELILRAMEEPTWRETL